MTRVLGLDLSLTATGYAYNDEVTGVIRSKNTGMRRLAEIRGAVMDYTYESDVVVIEGYGFNSQKAVVQGELGGVVRLALWDRRIPFVDVPPTVVKKFATGKGNADKVQVSLAASRRFGFEGDNDNAADAWLLRVMGLAYYAPTADAIPGYQLEALGKVSWPKLDIVERVG